MWKVKIVNKEKENNDYEEQEKKIYKIYKNKEYGENKENKYNKIMFCLAPIEPDKHLIDRP